MKFNKEFLTKNIASIISALIIVFMLFPMVSVSLKVNAGGFSGESDGPSVTGFQALTDGGGFAGILLIAIPLLLLLLNYVKQLQAYKKYIYLVAPILGLVNLIFLVPSSLGTASGGDASVEVKVKFLLGFWLMALGYVGLIAYGVSEFFNVKFKNGVPQIGDLSKINLPKVDLSKISTTKNQPQQNNDNNINQNNDIQGNEVASSTKVISAQQTDEILETIRKLHTMKQEGVLTDEEFGEKKKALLDRMD